MHATNCGQLVDLLPTGRDAVYGTEGGGCGDGQSRAFWPAEREVVDGDICVVCAAVRGLHLVIKREG